MKGERVLVVDDAAENRKLLGCLLELAGATILEAETGEDAINVALTQRPTLILMDISLPGMDGLTATRILKGNSETKHVPVVAVTADYGAQDEAIAAGCAGYVRKPIDTKTFCRAVMNLVEGSRQKSQALMLLLSV